MPVFVGGGYDAGISQRKHDLSGREKSREMHVFMSLMWYLACFATNDRKYNSHVPLEK